MLHLLRAALYLRRGHPRGILCREELVLPVLCFKGQVLSHGILVAKMVANQIRYESEIALVLAKTREQVVLGPEDCYHFLEFDRLLTL